MLSCSYIHCMYFFAQELLTELIVWQAECIGWHVPKYDELTIVISEGWLYEIQYIY